MIMILLNPIIPKIIIRHNVIMHMHITTISIETVRVGTKNEKLIIVLRIPHDRAY